MLKKRLIICLLILLPAVSYTQMRKFSANGSLIIQNYEPQEMGGNPQVFSIEQDDRGVMYFANQRGVLEYDGNTWRTITIGKGHEVGTLEKSPDGVIHVGGEGEYGILKPNEKGMMEFVSLRDQFPEPISKNLGQVRKIVFHNNQKIVQTADWIIIDDENNEQYTIPSETDYNNIFLVNSALYVIQKDRGLFKLVQDSLHQVDGGYIFATEQNDVAYITEFANRTIIVTIQGGIYEIDPHNEIIQLNILNDQALYSGININNEFLSIGTNSDGIRVLDRDLNLVFSVGLDKGIIDANIKSQFFDRENNLWLATNNGVTKVEIISPILRFDKESGVRSTVQSITKFNNRIYAAALDGVYMFGENGDVEKVPELNTDCYGLRTLNINGEKLLFVAEVNNVITVDRDNKYTIVEPGGPYDFIQSPLDSNEIIVLHYNGISNLHINEDGSLAPGKYFRDFSEGEPFNFIIQDDGTVLIGTKPNDGVYVGHINSFNDSAFKAKRWHTESGLPEGTTYLFQKNKTLFVATDSGLYYKNDDHFEPSDHFGIDFKKDKRGVHRISEDREGNVWMVLFDQQNNYEIGYAHEQDGKYIWKSSEFMRHATEVLHAIYHDENGITWLGGPEGMLRYDARVNKDYNIPFKALIREVRYGSKELFHGARGGKTKKDPTLDYSSHSSITFVFSGASFIDESSTEFSYKLEGYDKQWSDWSHMTVKEYNLPEGSYTFKVKARNIYGVESEIASYFFSILPPWYRTTWAYIGYVILFIVIVYLAIRFSIRRVKKQNQRLEQIVKERTAEVVSQKEEVEKQKEIVEEKNKDIMDSIRYAKHIQDAILPSDDFVAECFEDAFVLYKPKDIVSGDFYWVKRKENTIFFAAVDCTGHGVPGAFVSIVGNNGLNRAINEFNLREPGKILDKLTELVEESFKQQGTSDENVKDGMDMALCVLDLDENTLKYSGANNPLYLIRDGELLETKANKQPIGAFENREPFSTHTIEVKKNDRIFLFSDGFADQFGGPKGKKFKYKTFKKLLLENCDKPISTYRTILDQKFTAWKRELEQLDDVCVIGVRI